jgi:hypothetical protein
MAALQPAAPFRLSPTRFGLLVNRFERFAARVQGYFDRHGPGLGLYILSPVVAELVLGSSPPLTFLFFGWIDLLMYGGGAVIIRELVRRWGKGWPSILALGVAYGIAEEGLAIRSFFNPNWGGAVGLAGYGYVGGINWFWATEMAVYHSVVSITLPILLVSVAYRSRRDQAWIPGGSLARVAIGFVASILVCWAILPYAIGGAALFGCVAAMAVCYVVARRLPARVSWPVGWGSSGTRPAPKPTHRLAALSGGDDPLVRPCLRARIRASVRRGLGIARRHRPGHGRLAPARLGGHRLERSPQRGRPTGRDGLLRGLQPARGTDRRARAARRRFGDGGGSAAHLGLDGRVHDRLTPATQRRDRCGSRMY